MENTWSSDADIFSDLHKISEFCPEKPVVRLSPSEFMKRARGKPSIYDYDDDEEVVETCIPVRGYPLRNLRKPIVKPGGIPSFLEKQMQTAAQIREVAGLGHSNDLIERAFKHQYQEMDSNENKHMMPDLRLKATKRISPINWNHCSETNNVAEPAVNNGIVQKVADARKRSESPSVPLFNIITGTSIDINSKKDFPDLS